MNGNSGRIEQTKSLQGTLQYICGRETLHHKSDMVAFYNIYSIDYIVRGILETHQRDKLQKHIQKKIESLKRSIDAYQTLTQPIAPDNAIGRLTRMEAINSKSINEAALSKARQTLSRMERALKMIHHPDFGLCRECEEPIPFARLLIVPESDLCVECAGALGS